jgi:hypothetical protein
MNIFLKLVTNRNSLKPLVKDFYIDELQKFFYNLEVIIKQRKERQDKLKERYKQKIEAIKSLLSEQYLTVDDLTADPPNHIFKLVKVKKKLAPKYQTTSMASRGDF